MNRLNKKHENPYLFLSGVLIFLLLNFFLTWKGIWGHLFDYHFDFLASGGLKTWALASLLQAVRGNQNQGPSYQQACPWVCDHTLVFRSLRPYNIEKETDVLQASLYTLNIFRVGGFFFLVGTSFDLITKPRKRINYAQNVMNVLHNYVIYGPLSDLGPTL